MEIADPIIPLWLKVSYSFFVAVLVPVYYVHYGPRNFLWFSDVALFTTVAALWLESALLASMMALAVLLPEVVWNASFFGRMLTGWRLSGLAGYMFDRSLPRYLRGLSLFHVFLPVLLVWMVWRLGYDPRALLLQTVLAWIILPVTYRLSTREENINWVYGPGGRPPGRLQPLAYLGLVMLVFPLGIYVPTHFVLIHLFG